MVERENRGLPISQQCRMLSSVYWKPAEVSTEDLSIMALNDGHYLARPYYIMARAAGRRGWRPKAMWGTANSWKRSPIMAGLRSSIPNRACPRESDAKAGSSQFVSDEFRHAEAAWDHDQHGRPEMLWGEQREKGIIVAANNRRGARCHSPMT
jgi:hypothetical protein